MTIPVGFIHTPCDCEFVFDAPAGKGFVHTLRLWLCSFLWYISDEAKREIKVPWRSHSLGVSVPLICTQPACHLIPTYYRPRT